MELAFGSGIEKRMTISLQSVWSAEAAIAQRNRGRSGRPAHIRRRHVLSNLHSFSEPAAGISFSLEHGRANSGRLDTQEFHPDAAGVGAEHGVQKMGGTTAMGYSIDALSRRLVAASTTGLIAPWP